MPVLVLFILFFVAVGSIFLLFHMLMGSAIRPSHPEKEKLTIYECGEPTIGSAWIQFDLRYYVVALLFVVFDVEVAFLFPWAVVFGPLTTISHEENAEQRAALVKAHQLADAHLPVLPLPGETQAVANARAAGETITQRAAQSWALVAFVDVLVFFGVLLVGFAYLWRRGDLDWVRSISNSEPVQPSTDALLPNRGDGELVTVGSNAAPFERSIP